MTPPTTATLPLRPPPVRPCRGCIEDRQLVPAAVDLDALEDPRSPTHPCDYCGEQTRLQITVWPST